jgi:hypothetical protein
MSDFKDQNINSFEPLSEAEVHNLYYKTLVERTNEFIENGKLSIELVERTDAERDLNSMRVKFPNNSNLMKGLKVSNVKQAKENERSNEYVYQRAGLPLDSLIVSSTGNNGFLQGIAAHILSKLNQDVEKLLTSKVNKEQMPKAKVASQLEESRWNWKMQLHVFNRMIETPLYHSFDPAAKSYLAYEALDIAKKLSSKDVSKSEQIFLTGDLSVQNIWGDKQLNQVFLGASNLNQPIFTIAGSGKALNLEDLLSEIRTDFLKAEPSFSQIQVYSNTEGVEVPHMQTAKY